MAKSKGTTSKVKLTNKSTNKRLKSKRKHKLNRGSKTPIQIQNIRNSISKAKDEKKQKQNHHEASYLEEAPDSDADLDYVNNSTHELSLLSTNLFEEQKGKKNRYEDDRKEADYENAPRSFVKENIERNDDKKVKLLPLKGESGLIQRSRDASEQPMDYDVDPAEVADEKTTEGKDTPNVEASSYVDILANHRKDVYSKKVRIAELAQDIIARPDNIGLLKELILLCGKEQAAVIQKLSMLSLVEIFKDLIPDYRIRELTDQEHAIKVSRDVCALREFENSLLSNYQNFLTLLEGYIHDCFKLLKKRRKSQNPKANDGLIKANISLALTSIKCLCEMLIAAPHFNFRSNIIAVVVPKLGLSGEMLEIGTICFNSLKSVLIADEIGDVSLEIVKVVSKEVKSRISVKPKIIEILMFLQINSAAIKETEEEGNKKERFAKKKEMIMKLSKKEKKKKKFEDQLNKEMQEAENAEKYNKIGAIQTDILRVLFVIYFRILKADHFGSLLPVVLKGLAKFAHLINVDFFQDLMTVIEKILKMEDLGMNESLNCVYTAMKILSNQGEILTIDPKQFYSELYFHLLLVSADNNESNVAIAKNCVEEMLLKRRKKVSMVQVTGFFKRLATILLQMKSTSVIDYSLLVRSILIVHKRCDHLLDSDTCMQGVFQPEVPNPEYSNAESTSLWEMNLLMSHYDPNLNRISKHVLDGAPSQGIGSLPASILNRKKDFDKTKENIKDYFPEFVSTKPNVKCFVHTKEDIWKNKTLGSSLMEVCSEVETLT